MVDTVMQVSQESLTGMLFTTIISFVLPIALVVFVKVKLKAKVSTFFIGCVSFVFFAMFLESLFHGLVLKMTGDTFTEQKILYAIYAGLTAAIFEEIGRYVVMKYWMKNTLDRQNAIMYGVGHGGVEAITIIGFSYLSNYVVSRMINAGQLEKSLSAMDATLREETIQSLSPLWEIPGYQFYVAGVERISAIILQIALSYLVYKAIQMNEPKMMGLAMLIHFLVDCVTIILSLYLSIFVVEALLFGIVAVIAIFIFRMYRQEKTTDIVI